MAPQKWNLKIQQIFSLPFYSRNEERDQTTITLATIQTVCFHKEHWTFIRNRTTTNGGHKWKDNFDKIDVCRRGTNLMGNKFNRKWPTGKVKGALNRWANCCSKAQLAEQVISRSLLVVASEEFFPQGGEHFLVDLHRSALPDANCERLIKLNEFKLLTLDSLRNASAQSAAEMSPRTLTAVNSSSPIFPSPCHVKVCGEDFS